MQKTVLIVEDHTDIRLLTRFMVESFGYSVIEAKDGFEAVREAMNWHPDLILMDIAMPQMNGITAATLIKREDDFGDVPIIAVTAYGKEYIDEAEAYGFDEVIEKPFVIDEIHDVLDHYLGAVDS
jgi:two-component system cell cycle response regulator DivK